MSRANHEAWSRRLKRSVRLCRSSHTFGLFLYANHNEFDHLFRGVTRSDYIYCRSAHAGPAGLVRGVICLICLSRYSATKNIKKNGKNEENSIKDEDNGRQSKVHVTPDNEPCIIFPGNCLCGPKFATKSRRRLIDGLAEHEAEGEGGLAVVGCGCFCGSWLKNRAQAARSKTLKEI